MTGTIILVVLLALFIGYAKLQRGKGQPLSKKEGKQQLVVGVVWTLAVLTSGTWYALSSGESGRHQHILLFIVVGGTVAVLIGAGVAALRNKLAQKTKKVRQWERDKCLE